MAIQQTPIPMLFPIFPHPIIRIPFRIGHLPFPMLDAMPIIPLIPPPIPPNKHPKPMHFPIKPSPTIGPPVPPHKDPITITFPINPAAPILVPFNPFGYKNIENGKKKNLTCAFTILHSHVPFACVGSPVGLDLLAVALALAVGVHACVSGGALGG
jgi:hypothetical protein